MEILELPPLEAPPEEKKNIEPVKIETRGRPRKFSTGFNNNIPLKQEYKKTGEYIIKFAERIKEVQKGEKLDKDLKKDWVKAFDDFLKSKNINFGDSPLIILILTSLELIIDIFDLDKVFIALNSKLEAYKKKNESKEKR